MCCGSLLSLRLQNKVTRIGSKTNFMTRKDIGMKGCIDCHHCSCFKYQERSVYYCTHAEAPRGFKACLDTSLMRSTVPSFCPLRENKRTKSWKLFETEICPDCFGHLEVCTANKKDGWCNDGDAVRCMDCVFASAVLVDENGNAWVQKPVKH